MTPGLASRLAAAGMSRAEAERKQALFERTEAALRDWTGTGAREMRRWFVPGRVEVFGKHTDYAGGRSLVCALERGFCVVAAPRDDALLCVTDTASGDRVEIPLSPESHGSEPQGNEHDWTVYPRTVARRLARNFPGAIAGIDLALASDLPRSVGLSSSSALVVAVFTALAARNRLEDRPAWRDTIRSCEDLAGYLGAVENGSDFGPLTGGKGVGTFGGSEDHAAILCCRAGSLSLFSFCPVRLEEVIVLPADLVFVIGGSGVTAEKTGDARELYNRESRSAQVILGLWRSATGRADATLAEAVRSSPKAAERLREILRRSSHPSLAGEELLARFGQFHDESERIVPAAARALVRGDLAALGELAGRSQAGAERGLGNQVPETIELVRSARELGAVAASAFGAGFGGSVWALVRASGAVAFREEWERMYRRKFPCVAEGAFFASGAGPALCELS